MKYRVSHIEAFRRFEQDEEAEVADLIESIAGRSEPTERMRAGTAFHKGLELWKDSAVCDLLEVDGFTFTFRSDMRLYLPLTRELRASKTWIVDGAPITVSGQVDAIDGLCIHDHKTTSRFDPERYIAGCQWKLYLDIFGASVFRWNVFEINELDLPGHYEVRDQHTLEQYRYPALGADCQALVERFARFVREHVQPLVAA